MGREKRALRTVQVQVHDNPDATFGLDGRTYFLLLILFKVEAPSALPTQPMKGWAVWYMHGMNTISLCQRRCWEPGGHGKRIEFGSWPFYQSFMRTPEDVFQANKSTGPHTAHSKHHY